MNGARLQVAIAALLFSTGGVAIKLAALSSWQIAGFRSLVAAAVLWIALPHWRKLPDRRVLLVSVAYGATLVLFTVANTLTTAAAAIFLQSSASLYVLIAAPRLLAEPRQPSDLPIVLALIGGVVLFFVGTDTPFATAPDPGLGNWIGAASGLTWAATLMGLRWLGRDSIAASGPDPTGAAVITGNLLAFAVCVPLAFPIGQAAVTDWLVVGYLGAFQIGLAYVFMVRGVKHLRTLEFSLILLLEPVMSAVWTWIVHGEALSGLALAGGALILAGVGAQALRQ
ncbi:MAG: DMT family transporter [bacterium]|nr:DMT family transporter [bacterium]MCP5065338.1 DMT family transporter [bacterium]